MGFPTITFVIAVVETLAFMIYIIVQTYRLRNEIKSMGRLIRWVPFVAFAPSVPQAPPNMQMPSQYPPSQQNVQVPPPYPPAFNPPYSPPDNPPPYTQCQPKQ